MWESSPLRSRISSGRRIFGLKGVLGVFVSDDGLPLCGAGGVVYFTAD